MEELDFQQLFKNLFAAECKITFKIQAASVMHCSFCIIRAILLFFLFFFFIPLRYDTYVSRSDHRDLCLGKMHRGQACSHRTQSSTFSLKIIRVVWNGCVFKDEIQNIYIQVKADTIYIYIHTHTYVYIKEIYVRVVYEHA